MDKSEYKILVAEDDEIVRGVIEKFLTEEGYPVIMANDGLEAMKVLRQEDVHLVLTDLRMPGADGMEVLRTAIQINPRIAVVLLTAYGTLDTALEAMKEGAYDYIVKPFVMQQLLLAVRNAFKMASLIKENEMLSRQLKETYRDLEACRNPVKGVKDASEGAVEIIHTLAENNIIDKREAGILKERIDSGNKNGDLKKYGILVNELKGK